MRNEGRGNEEKNVRRRKNASSEEDAFLLLDKVSKHDLLSILGNGLIVCWLVDVLPETKKNEPDETNEYTSRQEDLQKGRRQL